MCFLAGTAVYTKDVRLKNETTEPTQGKDPSQTPTDSDTIAAIVTAMGSQQGAVAIVRLSGTSAVEIVGRLFRPARRAKDEISRSNLWKPQSHRVEYGTLVDELESLVDEVQKLKMIWCIHAPKCQDYNLEYIVIF